MLKGHVFKEQRFSSEIFALFIDTFLNKKCGIVNNYQNNMNLTYNSNTITINSGCICVRGRFIEEDTFTSIPVGTDNAFCKLVIEIDLSKENTENLLNQLSYKLIKNANSYPILTQTDIVANNTGIYQYELCQFKTGLTGITDFIDKRTYLDFDSIYNSIKIEFESVLNELEQELADVKDGSAYMLKSMILSGTEQPSDEIGNNGDLYIQYVESE